MQHVHVRAARPTDDIDALTDLLHRAYAVLGAMGFNYTAVDQTPEVTRARLAKGLGLVALEQERIVGTVTFHYPGWSAGTRCLERKDVAHFGQFAVEPDLQKRGLGSMLMDHVEVAARVTGATEIALDTAEGAAHLIRWYGQRGYRTIEVAQWRGKTYRSVIMSKAL